MAALIRAYYCLMKQFAVSIIIDVYFVHNWGFSKAMLLLARLRFSFFLAKVVSFDGFLGFLT